MEWRHLRRRWLGLDCSTWEMQLRHGPHGGVRASKRRRAVTGNLLIFSHDSRGGISIYEMKLPSSRFEACKWRVLPCSAWRVALAAAKRGGWEVRDAVWQLHGETILLWPHQAKGQPLAGSVLAERFVGHCPGQASRLDSHWLELRTRVPSSETRSLRH